MKYLSLNILADENICLSFINVLESSGFNVISVKNNYTGFKDSEIIDIAVRSNALIVTEDRDFGEWVFSHQLKTTGIIYLRYNNNQKEEIIKELIHVLKKYSETLYNKFTVITPEKIRIRDL